MVAGSVIGLKKGKLKTWLFFWPWDRVVVAALWFVYCYLQHDLDGVYDLPLFVLTFLCKLPRMV